jgi:hypothetical protein
MNVPTIQKNSLFSQAVAIVVEIEDWSGKRGRFFGVPKLFILYKPILRKSELPKNFWKQVK